tara:strand:- start:180 stop:728 length:549 start_codon:yes stop_codon:yes gene_type:complete
MSRYIVLGRFQPFHKGHEFLVNSAFDLAGDSEVIIAIGSASKGWEPNNPWTLEERTEMVNAWLAEQNKSATIVGINDINDPPNWVKHATDYHGDGVLVTSDEATKKLYQESDFLVEFVDLSNRANFEGWRVRQTLLMLSTVYDDDAVKEVLSATLPKAVINWLVDNDAIYRLSTMVSGVNVG